MAKHFDLPVLKKVFKLQRFSTTVFLMAFIALSCSTAEEKAPEDTSYRFDPRYESSIDSLIAQMTLDEKVGMLHGTGMFVSGGVERLGIPEFHYTDGPNGVREELERHSWNPLNLADDSATFFPSGSALAATWNKELARKYGEALGLETRARDKDMILGPAVNIMRTPIGGRTFEYFSEDPYLNSQITVEYVRGVQSKDVAVCVKHFAANNQEFERNSVSIEVSERALREIYLPAYKAAVHDADAMGMMGAYNRFRGEYLCQNDYLNNQVLKGEFGFQGMIVSDWGATHNTVTAALGGLDVEMGTHTIDQNYDQNFLGHPLRDSVLAGVVPMSVIDDKVKRILRVSLNLNKMEGERVQGELVSPRTTQTAYDVASEAIVLLKNDKQLLPLRQDKIESIAVIGFNADRSQAKGGFTAGVKPKYEISPLEGLQNKLGKSVQINYALGYRQMFEEKGNWRTPAVKTPDEQLIDEAVEAAMRSDVAVIFAGNTREIETETLDRASLDLPFGQDELIRAVVAANPNTIVVVVAGAPVNLNVSKNLVPAILYGWFNGSEAGTAIADVLFGDVVPSGKLPFTIPEKLSDVGVHALDAYPGANGVMEYKEGILVGYRWFDTKNISPAYPFGHGLSYANFSYNNLKLNAADFTASDRIELSLTLKNESAYDAKEVVQCYVRHNNSQIMRADKELKAFGKVMIPAGGKKNVELSFDASDLAYYDETAGSWVLEPGTYTLMTGSSSRDLRAEATFTIQ
jgi:beta-glucosidase